MHMACSNRDSILAMLGEVLCTLNRTWRLETLPVWRPLGPQETSELPIPICDKQQRFVAKTWGQIVVLGTLYRLFVKPLCGGYRDPPRLEPKSCDKWLQNWAQPSWCNTVLVGLVTSLGTLG
ncbi:hypothetical protein CEP52_011164 [Fusarium oligoseptatum]|uniref:Uncharacterized protein n=2 Tax=Fusarium solani species complex TaxID=232080 RepID=A0A428T4I4_9HYPO|nr:hypothetical protein CDV31_015225 [Fusarium ambrosium]RSL96935.1 hypothetical protein CEP52_011164 [Fusarium oligoseptatum]